jgi:hypothetical protein
MDHVCNIECQCRACNCCTGYCEVLAMRKKKHAFSDGGKYLQGRCGMCDSTKDHPVHQ